MAEKVNDIHSGLNETTVAQVLHPQGIDAIVAIVQRARSEGVQLSICGGRHAMGGQQFGRETWLVDLRQHAAIRQWDEARGLITVDAGIQWPALIEGILHLQGGASTARWGIRQKQTGADALTLGGALAANIHGRGLLMAPIVEDVESFRLVDAAGEIRTCSRTENHEWFAFAIGGYGMAGVIAEVTLRLVPRYQVERKVEVINLQELVRVPEERDTTDWVYGDFQFSIDETSPDFLQRGVFSAYKRCAEVQPLPSGQMELREDDWRQLILLAHTDRSQAFVEYARYYLATDGQRYWSDTHQLATYVDDYHAAVDRCLGQGCRGSEMISEIYVPRAALATFMGEAATLLRCHGVPVIYGTVRLIERDEETVLAWAREPWACIIFNLHVEHHAEGLALAAEAFRGLIDLAIAHGGSYYLTYHRWATREQVLACHPQFRAFLAKKKQLDPEERFTSDWYRHHVALLGEA